MRIRLSDRNPQVTRERLVAELVPPPRFAEVSFDSYRPDPGQSSQQQAVDHLRGFADDLNRPVRKKGLLRRGSEPAGPGGVYLDGGYGVGKTHLLASLWHAAPGPKLFATFVELTHLVGALGFHDAVAARSSYRLVCVDEFELDDPGDTVLISTLLRNLREHGVRLAATSNTLPAKLGEGRFATEDFLREIQGLASSLESIRIGGEGYRCRGLPDAPEAPDLDEVKRRADQDGASFDHFVDLTRHPPQVHPSKYGALLDGVSVVCPEDVRTVDDQATALRLAVLADRMYDRGLPSPRAAGRSTSCSPLRCSRAATARSTSVQSAGWSPWHGRAPACPKGSEHARLVARRVRSHRAGARGRRLRRRVRAQGRVRPVGRPGGAARARS